MNLGLIGAIGGLGAGISSLGQSMMKDIESREADARQRAIDEWKLRMQEEYAIRKDERAAAAQEAMQRRDADILMRADDAAKQSLREREFERFRNDLGQTDASEAQLREVFERQYFDREVAPGDANSRRYDPANSEFSRERFRQAQHMGASSGLLKTVYDDYKLDLSLEDKEQQRERQARLDAMNERRTNALIEQGERRAAAAEASSQAALLRATRSPAEGRSSDDGEKEIKRLERRYKIAMDAKPKEPKLSTKRAREDYQAELARWEMDHGEAVRAYMSALQGGPVDPPATPQPGSAKVNTQPISTPPSNGQRRLSDLPPGTRQIGTANGRPVYQLPDGTRVIKQ